MSLGILNCSLEEEFADCFKPELVRLRSGALVAVLKRGWTRDGRGTVRYQRALVSKGELLFHGEPLWTFASEIVEAVN